jgi:acetyl esterase/lipase
LLGDLFDPEIRESLRQLPEVIFSEETLPMLREFAASVPDPDPEVERQELTVGTDAEVKLTVLRPSGASVDLPALFWIHGGGMVIGNRYMDDSHLNRWCRTFSCACISVEYRLAPETPYPGPADDCDTGLQYVFDHAAELGVDPGRVGVGGRSAGAGVAAALALRDRDRGENRLLFQLLYYPMLDDRQQTPSSQFDGLPLFSRESCAFSWRSYLAGRYGSDDVPPDAAPARAADLSGLPPAFISVGTVDGLRDEAIGYATRLIAASVPTELHVYSGAVHGFEMFSDTAVARCAIRDSDSWLGRQLACT